MKRIALLFGALASIAGSAFADIAVGPNPADFIPITSGDPATVMFIVAVPVAVLVVAAIALLWYLRSHKSVAVSAAKGAAGGAAQLAKKK